MRIHTCRGEHQQVGVSFACSRAVGSTRYSAGSSNNLRRVRVHGRTKRRARTRHARPSCLRRTAVGTCARSRHLWGISGPSTNAKLRCAACAGTRSGSGGCEVRHCACATCPGARSHVGTHAVGFEVSACSHHQLCGFAVFSCIAFALQSIPREVCPEPR